jgi:hypothetical protein
MFFFEKKNQKTSTSPQVLLREAMASIVGNAEKIKVFCFFPSEKKAFLNCPRRPANVQVEPSLRRFETTDGRRWRQDPACSTFPSGDARSGGSQRLHLCPSVSICGLPSLLFPSWRDVGRGTWFVPIVS